MIPKSFFPVCTTLNDFSRNKIRVSAQANTTFNPNDVMIFQLPEGKVDLSTFSIGGKVTTTTTDGYCNVCNVESLIESFYIEIGGISITPAFNYYNQIFQIHSDYQGVWNRKNFRSMLQLQPTSNAAVSANQTAVPFQMNQWLGFLKDCRVLQTDRLPPVRIYLKLATPAVLACGPDGVTPAAGANYQLNQVYAMVDLLGLSPAYDVLISDKLNSGGTLQIPFTNFSAVPCAAGSIGTSARWSTSANCLEAVYGTFISTGYNSSDQVKDSTTYLSPYFTRGSTNMGSGFTSRFTVNGVSYPNVPMEAARGEILLHTLESLNEQHDLTTETHPNLSSLTNFAQKFFLHVNSFTFVDEESGQRLAGLSGLGNSLGGTYETTTTSNDTAIPLIFLRHKSILEIAAQRNVRYIH